MRKSLLDLVIAGLLIGLSVLGLIESRHFFMDAEIFPRILFSLLLLFSSIMGFSALRRLPQEPVPTENRQLDNKYRPYVVGVLMTAYILIMPFVGFFPASIVLTGSMAFVLNVQNYKLYLTITAGALVFVFVLLRIVLLVPLPEGVLFS